MYSGRTRSNYIRYTGYMDFPHLPSPPSIDMSRNLPQRSSPPPIDTSRDYIRFMDLPRPPSPPPKRLCDCCKLTTDNIDSRATTCVPCELQGCPQFCTNCKKQTRCGNLQYCPCMTCTVCTRPIKKPSYADCLPMCGCKEFPEYARNTVKIFGCSKSGKTTLARRIVDNQTRFDRSEIYVFTEKPWEWQGFNIIPLVLENTRFCCLIEHRRKRCDCKNRMTVTWSAFVPRESLLVVDEFYAKKLSCTQHNDLYWNSAARIIISRKEYKDNYYSKDFLCKRSHYMTAFISVFREQFHDIFYQLIARYVPKVEVS